MDVTLRNQELIEKTRKRIKELEEFSTRCKKEILPLVKSSIRANKDLLNFLLYKSGYH